MLIRRTANGDRATIFFFFLLTANLFVRNQIFQRLSLFKIGRPVINHINVVPALHFVENNVPLRNGTSNVTRMRNQMPKKKKQEFCAVSDDLLRIRGRDKTKKIESNLVTVPLNVLLKHSTLTGQEFCPETAFTLKVLDFQIP